MKQITEIELYHKVKEVTPKNKYYQGIPVIQRDDLLIDVYELALIALRDGKIKGDWDEIKGYVFMIGLNSCKQVFRKLELKNKAFTTPRDINGDVLALEELYTFNDESKDDIIKEVVVMIDGMKDDTTREIFNLVLEGYTMIEIALTLDIPVNSAKSKYSRMVTKLRKHNADRVTSKKRKVVVGVKYNRKIRRVINTVTQEIYESVAEAARQNNIKYGTLNHYLNGTRTNKTKLKYYDPSNYKKNKE